MLYIYDIVVRVIYFFFLLASVFNKKARKWILGRKDFFKKNYNLLKLSNKRVWFHVASLGEFEQAKPLIEAFKNCFNYSVIITFFSPSGYEHSQNYPYADLILYLPLDTKKNAKKFISFFKPNIAIFVKYDLWFNYIYCLKKSNIPVFLISATFRKNQIYFKWYGGFFKEILKKLDFIYVQNEQSKELLKSKGINNVKVSGDTRIDRVLIVANTQFSDAIIEKFINNRFCVICGSVWLKDIKIFKDEIIKTINECCWIIVPHDVSQKNVHKIINKLSVKCIKYTDLINYKGIISDNIENAVLIVNIIGILNKIYKYADIVYIGGGFNKGIHNILEPAVYGKPVIFGKKNYKFVEAAELKSLNAGFEVKNKNDFYLIFNKLFKNKTLLNKAGNAAYNFIINNKGASDFLINEFKNYLIKID